MDSLRGDQIRSGIVIESLQLNSYLLDLPINLEWSPFIIIAGNGGAEVGTDVETLTRCERGGHGHLHRGSSDFFAINAEDDVSGRSGLRSLEHGLHDDRVFTGRDRFCRLRDRAVDDHEVVFKNELPLIQSSWAAAIAALPKHHKVARSLKMFLIDRSYFLRYLMFVAPMVPLNLNGAWSK